MTDEREAREVREERREVSIQNEKRETQNIGVTCRCDDCMQANSINLAHRRGE